MEGEVLNVRQISFQELLALKQMEKDNWTASKISTHILPTLLNKGYFINFPKKILTEK